MRNFTGIALLAGIVLLGACDRAPKGGGSGASSDNQASGSGQGNGGPSALPAAEVSEAELSPEEQGASKGDHEITLHIRHAIQSDSQFSAQAKNLKVVTVNGKVTIRGPVSNVHEQRAIASIARRAAGVNSIDNQMEVTNKVSD